MTTTVSFPCLNHGCVASDERSPDTRSTSRPLRENNRRLGITGANGFIGKALVQATLAAGFQVTAIILPGTPADELESAGARVVALPLVGSPELGQVLGNLDLLVNLAGTMQGRSADRYREANVETVRGLLAASRRIEHPPKLLHLSSVAAAGPTSGARPPAENAHPRPVSLYGRTKLAGERVALDWPGSLILRPPSIYGPEDRCFFDLFKWAQHGVFPLLCTRSKRFNLLFRDDLIRLLLQVLDRPDLSGILHLGFPVVHTAVELAEGLGEAAGRHLSPLFLPCGAVRLLARISGVPEMLGGHPDLMSPGKAEEMSHPTWLQDFSRMATIVPPLGGFEPTPLRDGLLQTMHWYKEQRWL